MTFDFDLNFSDKFIKTVKYIEVNALRYNVNIECEKENIFFFNFAVGNFQ